MTAARGSIIGNIELYNNQQMIYSGYPNKLCIDSKMLPSNLANLRIQIKNNVDIKYIVVLEKDAALNQCSNSKWCQKHCILITCQGYPALQCRKLLKLIHKRLDIPIFRVVNCDPHGLDIFLA